MTVSIVVAVSQNGVIGRDGELPWRLSGDLKRFKKLTTGHPLIMGRRTFDSIGRALPDRVSIVLTRNPERVATQERVMVATGWDQALQLAEQSDFDTSEVFVVGGAEIYRQAWDRANRLYRTIVHAHLDGDASLEPLNLDDWVLAKSVDYPPDESNEYPCTWEVWDRVGE